MRLRSIWLTHWLLVHLPDQLVLPAESLTEIEGKLRRLVLRECVANVAAYAEYVRRLLTGGTKAVASHQAERDIELTLHLLKPMSQLRVVSAPCP